LLAGNKADLADGSQPDPAPSPSIASSSFVPESFDSRRSGGMPPSSHGSISSNKGLGLGLGSQQTASIAPEGREVPAEIASHWASANNIPVSVEVSAYTGENVDEVFARLARMILTRIELGEIDPDDPRSGIQYGDAWSGADGGSVKSGMTVEEGGSEAGAEEE
ncbi:hypothetical protein LTS18_014759, partial [Coniosporium uncinatum]